MRNRKAIRNRNKFYSVLGLLLFSTPSPTVHVMCFSMMFLPLLYGKGEIIYLLILSSYVSYFLYKIGQIYFRKNVGIFSILFFISTGLSPFLHCINYYFDKESYSISPKLEAKNLKFLKEDLVHQYGDTLLIRAALNKIPALSLNSLPIQNKFYGSIYFNSIDQTGTRINHSGFLFVGTRPPMHDTHQLLCYAKNNKLIFSFENNPKLTVKESLEKYLINYEQEKKALFSQPSHILYRDIWFASVFGFWTEHIGVESYTGYFIRLLQILSLIGFLTMISTWLNSLGIFKLTLKK